MHLWMVVGLKLEVPEANLECVELDRPEDGGVDLVMLHVFRGSLKWIKCQVVQNKGRSVRGPTFDPPFAASEQKGPSRRQNEHAHNQCSLKQCLSADGGLLLYSESSTFLDFETTQSAEVGTDLLRWRSN